MTDGPQIYLVTPATLSGDFGQTLRACLDAAPVAALRLTLTGDDDTLRRSADLVREIAHPFDLPVLISGRVDLVAPLGIDGSHIPFRPGAVAQARAALPEDAVLGVHCGSSRHDGLEAGEAGADYVAFSAATDHETFAWWAEMIELPVVAEGPLDGPALDILGAVADFLALRDEVWSAASPPAALAEIAKRLG